MSNHEIGSCRVTCSCSPHHRQGRHQWRRSQRSHRCKKWEAHPRICRLNPLKCPHNLVFSPCFPDKRLTTTLFCQLCHSPTSSKLLWIYQKPNSCGLRKAPWWRLQCWRWPVSCCCIACSPWKKDLEVSVEISTSRSTVGSKWDDVFKRFPKPSSTKSWIRLGGLHVFVSPYFCDLLKNPLWFANLIERHLESFTVPVWIAEISHVTAASNGAQRNVVGQLSNELSHTSFDGHILSGPWTRTYRAILLYTGMRSWESCKCYESSSTVIKHLTWENLGMHIHTHINYNISRSSGKQIEKSEQ